MKYWMKIIVIDRLICMLNTHAQTERNVFANVNYCMHFVNNWMALIWSSKATPLIIFLHSLKSLFETE